MPIDDGEASEEPCGVIVILKVNVPRLTSPKLVAARFINCAELGVPVARIMPASTTKATIGPMIHGSEDRRARFFDSGADSGAGSVAGSGFVFGVSSGTARRIYQRTDTPK